jgi:hypothetical protein
MPGDDEEPKKRVRPHHPRPVKVVDLDGNPISRVHPPCIFKQLPKGKLPCYWRLKSGRCRKRRMHLGDAFQLDAEGNCPAYRPRIPKRDLKDGEPAAPPVQEGVRT